MGIERIGEVCLLTSDVPHLADFYRKLLDVPPGEDAGNWGHQFVLVKETSLSIIRDDTPRSGQGAVLAFTVKDIHAARQRLLAMGVEIAEPPTARPWGAVNMSFWDPDGNLVFFRCFPEESHSGS